MLLVAEPNKKQLANGPWFKDNDGDAAIRIYNKQVSVINCGIQYKGFVWIELDKLAIYSCYISPNSTMEEFGSYLRELGKSIRKQGKDVLVAGDFNAKARIWGSKREDDRGKQLLEWMAELSLVSQNRGDAPTFVRGDSESHLDLTITTERIAGQVTGWVVEDEENLSLHRNIYYQLVTPLSERKKPQKIGWRINSTDIPEFMTYLRAEANKRAIKDATTLTDSIVKALDNTFPRKDTRFKHRPAYWWNENLTQKRKECLAQRRKLTRLNKGKDIAEEVKEQARSNYRHARKILRNSIIAAKEAKWKITCKEIDNDLWGEGFKIACKKYNMNPKITLTEEKQLEIAKRLFPEHPRCNWRHIDTGENDIPLFTEDEVQQVGKRIKAKRATGPDLIQPEIVKEIIKEMPKLIMEVANQHLIDGVFPNIWKRANLLLIEKPKKGDGPISYRPICLLNVLAKTLEHLLSTRLTAEVSGKLSNNQYGFRKGRSTVSAMHKIIEKVRSIRGKACRNRNYAALVTLDIKNAFNSAPWKGIMETLEKLNVSKYLQKILGSYLQDRRIVLNEGREMAVTSGVPQGSVLGPLLWNIYYNSILELKLPEGVTVIGFADDTALMVEAKSAELLQSMTNIALNQIVQAIIGKHLELALEKTEVLILYGGRKIKNITLAINNHELTSSKKIKYLGVTFGHNLNMREHVFEIVKKAEKTVAALSRIMPNISGPRASKRRVLASVVHSIILYAAPIWEEITRTKKYMNILSGLQRRIAIRVGSAYRTISTEAIQVITGITPIDLQLEERKNSYRAEHAKKEIKADTIREWQKKWERDTQKAQWTKKLIRNLEKWLHRKHGEIDYYMTQFLGGHGCFGTYFKRFRLKDIEECWYCGDKDTPEHTFFGCDRWAEERSRTNDQLGEIITVENVINIMTKNESNWNTIHGYVRQIIQVKEEDERLMEQS